MGDAFCQYELSRSNGIVLQLWRQLASCGLTGPTQTQTTNTSRIATAGSWILQRNPVTFPVAVDAASEITAIIPDSGGQGMTVGATITGTNLDGATAVTFTGTGVTATIGSG